MAALRGSLGDACLTYMEGSSSCSAATCRGCSASGSGGWSVSGPGG
jgi:hypothetical protein